LEEKQTLLGRRREREMTVVRKEMRLQEEESDIGMKAPITHLK
jgi:hypothetical protein